jgi:hypothetical protein
MSGLNKTEGEFLGDLGRGVVAPVEKWANEYGMFDMACQAAHLEFRKKGVPATFKFEADNVTVQEYFLQSKIVFLFWVRHAGVDIYYPYVWDLGPEARLRLSAAGKWPAIYAAPSDMRAS